MSDQHSAESACVRGKSCHKEWTPAGAASCDGVEIKDEMDVGNYALGSDVAG